VKNGGISRKIKGLLQYWEGVLKKKFVKFVVQDLTSGGHEWMRAKWSAPIRKYWKISEQMMVKYMLS
jgi:glycosyltransferase